MKRKKNNELRDVEVEKAQQIKNANKKNETHTSPKVACASRSTSAGIFGFAVFVKSAFNILEYG